jgi:hypothetical protein
MSERRSSIYRAAGVAGVLAAALIFGGLYLMTMGSSGSPGPDADGAAWSSWARQEEQALEIGVYALLVPGLLLFLVMFAAFAGRQPADVIWTRLAGYGAVAFFVFFAAAGVLSSTTASAFGYYRVFEDPTAVTYFTLYTAGYHLQAVGSWSLAMTMVATAIGLRQSGSISSPSYLASIALAALAVAGTFVGFGVVFCLIWILAVSIGLLRSGRPAE